MASAAVNIKNEHVEKCHIKLEVCEFEKKPRVQLQNSGAKLCNKSNAPEGCPREDKCHVKLEVCEFEEKPKVRPQNRGRKYCKKFNTPEGCPREEKCKKRHPFIGPRRKPICHFYKKWGTCRYGSICYFRHIDPNGNLVETGNVTTQSSSMEDETTLKDSISVVGKDLNKNDEISECPPDTQSNNRSVKVKQAENNMAGQGMKRFYVSRDAEIMCKEMAEEYKLVGGALGLIQTHYGTMSENAVPDIGHNEGGSSSTTDMNRNDQTNFQDVQNETKSGPITMVTCGECGQKFELNRKARGEEDMADESFNVDDNDIDDSDDLDELEKHYMEKLMKFDKNHIKFLKNSNLFKEWTSCGVCGKWLKNSRRLLNHIRDKIKLKQKDWKMHEEFLTSIVMAFTDRDYGIDNERELLDSLLLHLVISYTGDSGDDTENDVSSSSGSGLTELIGLMAHSYAHKDKKKSSLDDAGSDDSFSFGEFDSDDVYELACQGIKPWDPEAGAALAVLNGYF